MFSIGIFLSLTHPHTEKMYKFVIYKNVLIFRLNASCMEIYVESWYVEHLN